MVVEVSLSKGSLPSMYEHIEWPVAGLTPIWRTAGYGHRSDLGQRVSRVGGVEGAVDEVRRRQGVRRPVSPMRRW